MWDIASEAFGTFLFVTTILMVTNYGTNGGLKNNFFIYAVIAIGLTYSRFMASRSGGAINPAIALMLEIFQSFHDLDFKYLINFYVYIIGPGIGGLVAGIFYKKVVRPAYKQDSDNALPQEVFIDPDFKPNAEPGQENQNNENGEQNQNNENTNEAENNAGEGQKTNN